jgi:hypothetical protein
VSSASFAATPAQHCRSSRVSKRRGKGEGGQACKKGLVTDPYTSGSLRSAQLSTAKTTSAYSQVAVQNQSATTNISIFGRVLTMTLWAHLALPRMELESAHMADLVGVGMWVFPVNCRLPTRRGRSS